MTEYSFFVVWNPNGRNPTMRHKSEQAARAEALRLARENQGQQFFILEACALFCKAEVTVTNFTTTRDIPF